MHPASNTRPRRAVFRQVAQIGLDGLAWFVGVAVAVLARFGWEPGQVSLTAVLAVAATAGLLQWLVGTAVFLYRGRYRFGSFDEVAGLAVTVLLVASSVSAGLLLGFAHRPVPASAPLLGGVVALVFMFAVRYMWRLRRERVRRPSAEGATRVLVFGAGDAGSQIVQAMLRDPAATYRPVGLLDDEPSKRRLRVSGVPVLGDRTAIAAAARDRAATALVVALPRADATLLRDLSALAEEADLTVKVLPTLAELMDHRVVGTGDIRDLDISDLLGRRQIDTDVESVAGYLTGKRVLVTGAGGSIGSELCRQLERYGPAELMMLDRDESALHAVQLSIYGRALLDSQDVVLADIRDGDTLRRLFLQRRPDVVFHAAALKHLPLLEQYPGEGYKSNVLGTLNVLEAARSAGVSTFVNISTDKAADPTSVLGHTKRVAERLTAWYAAHAGGDYLSVRFGNVLGSRGSVLVAFADQIARGGPVTVTHPDVTRFFMTIPEAVQLVIQASIIGRDGEALVLDMGEPVRILDVAKQLMARAPRRIDVVFTGLRPGEKLHEDLVSRTETGHSRVHPLISHVSVPALDPTAVLPLDPAASRSTVLSDLLALTGAAAAVPLGALSA